MIRSLSIALLLTLPLLAQQAEPSALAATPSPKPPALTVSVSFGGGTLGQFVNVLRAMEPKANIIVAPEAMAAQLPELELKGAGIEQALEAACSVALSEWQVRVKEFRGEGAPVFSILVAEQSRGRTAGQTQRTQVWSLVLLTNDADRGIGVKVETVLSAIDAATEGKLTQRFHHDSGLLIVRGVDEHIRVAREVLSELESDVKRRRSEAQPKGNQQTGNMPGSNAK